MARPAHSCYKLCETSAKEVNFLKNLRTRLTIWSVTLAVFAGVIAPYLKNRGMHDGEG